MCPNRDWISSFEKVDGCFAVMGDDHPCNIEGIDTVHIKMDDEIVRELKEVSMYLNSKKILSLLVLLKTLGLVVSIRDGVLKMTKGSMVVMKGVRRNNLYYLKGSTVTSQVETLFLQMMFSHRSDR